MIFVSAINPSITLLVDSNDPYAYTAAKYYEKVFDGFDVDINIIHLSDASYIIGDEWDVAIIKTSTPDFPVITDYISDSVFNTLLLNNNDRVGFKENQSYAELDSLIQLFQEYPENIDEISQNFTEVFTNEILTTIPLFQTFSYFYSNFEIINGDIYYSLLQSDTGNASYSVGRSFSAIFDPLQYDIVPPLMRPMIATLMHVNHGRISGGDMASRFVIEDFVNTKFASLPGIIKDGKISYFLKDRNYSDGVNIIPEDFIFTIQLLQSLNKVGIYNRIVDYTVDGNTLSFYFADRKRYDPEMLSSLFPTPTHLLNKTLHITVDGIDYEFDPLSGSYNIFDAVEWDIYENLGLSSGSYKLDFAYEASDGYRASYSNASSKIELYELTKSNAKILFDYGILDVLESAIDYGGWVSKAIANNGLYQLVFNLNRFEDFNKRLLYSKLTYRDEMLMDIKEEFSPIPDYYNLRNNVLPDNSSIDELIDQYYTRESGISSDYIVVVTYTDNWILIPVVLVPFTLFLGIKFRIFDKIKEYKN